MAWRMLEEIMHTSAWDINEQVLLLMKAWNRSLHRTCSWKNEPTSEGSCLWSMWRSVHLLASHLPICITNFAPSIPCHWFVLPVNRSSAQRWSHFLLSMTHVYSFYINMYTDSAYLLCNDLNSKSLFLTHWDDYEHSWAFLASQALSAICSNLHGYKTSSYRPFNHIP